MSLRNTIGSSDLETTDFAFPQDAVAGLCADAEYFAHLLNAHHIGIVFQKKLAAAVSRVASNINQICRRINSTGHFYVDDVAELKERQGEIWQLLKSSQSEEL